MFTVHIRYNGYANKQVYRLMLEINNCIDLNDAKAKATAWFKRKYISLNIISIL